MRVYLAVGVILCTGYCSYGQENKHAETTTEASFNAKLKSQFNVSVKKNDSYINMNASKTTTKSKTDERDNNDDNVRKKGRTKEAKVTETKPHNTTNIANIKIPNVANNSKPERFHMENINSSHSEIDGNNIEQHDIAKYSSCDKALGEICTRIEHMRKVPCGDGTFIPLDQLCNGEPDCLSKNDEINCRQRVYEQVQLANDILLDTANSSECLPQNMEGSRFSDDFKIWRNSLNIQLVCYKTNWQEISALISSMLDSFESHVCSPMEHMDIVTEDFFKLEADLENIITNHEIKNNPNWSPTSCTCNRQFCKSDYCDGRCRRICWQVYTLDHWGCQSVTGATSISLDFICDGKIDCIDESDETSCLKEPSAYKHKADTMYDELLKILSPKSKLQKYDHNKTEQLTDIVRQLQNLTVKTHNPDIDTVKTLRNHYFALLVGIFKNLWSTSSTVREINYAHDFLLLLNVNMVKALKHSYTGNKYTLPSAQCSCKNGACASVACSRKCNKFCFAEPILTNYSCDANNTFVSIKAICNGEKQCLNGEDEKDCKHEVCRVRQLDKLRINVQKAETLLKDSVFGKVLEDWKVKITQILMITENEDPNRKMLEDKVSKVLRELVVVYSLVADTSKSRDLEIKGFIKASNIVKQTLKTCGK